MDEEEEESDRTAELARRAIDRDRLLRGEDPNTTQLEDAEHWVRVYGELLEFKERTIGLIEAEQGRMLDVSREDTDIDLEVLAVQRDRLQERLRSWQRRVDELRG